jgi:hypothetical protein
MNPGKSTSAELHYEVRCIEGPRRFTVHAVDYDLVRFLNAGGVIGLDRELVT